MLTFLTESHKRIWTLTEFRFRLYFNECIDHIFHAILIEMYWMLRYINGFSQMRYSIFNASSLYFLFLSVYLSLYCISNHIVRSRKQKLQILHEMIYSVRSQWLFQCDATYSILKSMNHKNWHFDTKESALISFKYNLIRLICSLIRMMMAIQLYGLPNILTKPRDYYWFI